MQTLANTALGDPIYGVFAAIILVGALGLWVMRSAFAKTASRDPLAGLFDRTTFEKSVEQVEQHPPQPLHGQRAQMARLQAVWQREEATEAVARVMRAGKKPAPAPVRIDNRRATFGEAEWEEVKLLPQPGASGRSEAA